MSDARMEAARQKMDSGELQEAMALLKGLLAERPDDGEVRQALMELQELMMLDLQIQERLKRARGLAQQGDADGALKTVDEILKINPRHREALLLRAELASALPPLDGEGGLDLGELPPPPPLVESPTVAADGEFDFGELPSVLPSPSAQPAAPAGEQTEFDFSSVPPLPADFGAPVPAHESTATSGGGAASSLSPQEQSKVSQYLAEGKALQAQGRVQDAIDVWTRVFILDEENREAQSLIDQARSSLSAGQGELEFTLNEGIAAFNAGDYARAKPLLEKILQTSPGHREAQYYLSRIPAEAPAAAAAPDFELDGDFGAPAPAPPPPPAARPAAPAPAAPVSAASSMDGFELETGDADDFGPPSAPAAPAPAMEPLAAPAPAPPMPRSVAAGGRSMAAAKKGPPRLGLIFGVLGLLAVVGLGLVFIPKLLGGGSPPPPPKVAPSKPLVPKPVVQPAQPVTPAEPAEPQGKEALFQAAKEATAAKQYQKAIDYYRKVLALEALNPEAQTGLESARAAYQVQLEEEARNAKFLKDYQNSVRSYRDGDYAESLRLAWRLVYPDDTLAKQLGKATSVRLLLRNGYYNWAVRDLKSENPRGAEKNLRDLLDADKNDPEAKKLLDFTRKYIGRPVDAGYRDTVAALTYRPFEEAP